MRISDWSSDVCSSDLFNQLLARTLASDPHVKGGRRVVFLSSDDEGATASVAALAERLGFAPVNLGTLEEGGALVQAREDKSWGPLIFQDLFKHEPERPAAAAARSRSEEHTSELQSLMRISYAVFCLKQQNTTIHI